MISSQVEMEMNVFLVSVSLLKTKSIISEASAFYQSGRGGEAAKLKHIYNFTSID